MPEGVEGYIPPKTVIETPKPQETLKSQHFNYTLVFGQGPVQETDKIPQTGREGLNFYSRLEAKAAAEMLRHGITDKLILSGGKTGARAQTEDGKTEAELMMDLIKTDLDIDEAGNFYNFKGEAVKFSDAVLIENLAKDTLENFVQIVNKFIDKDGLGKTKMALLGIGFHAHATNNLGVGGADIGRLEALSSIYKIGAPTYSAEEVLKELVINTHDEDSAIASIMGRLTDLSENSNVTLLKAQQEGVLVDMLKEGDWLRVLDVFQSEDRIKQILASQPETLKDLGISQGQLGEMNIDDIRVKIKDLFGKIKPTQTLYPKTKPAIFKAFESMGTVDADGNTISQDILNEENAKKAQIIEEGKKSDYKIRRNILTYYGKGELKKPS